jgi:lysozyme
MRITTVSQDCIDLVKRFEGFSSKPYLCPASVCTIGYGTTIYPNGRRVRLEDKSLTEKEAEDILKHELNEFGKRVDSMTIDSINQAQFDALTSFAYNLGANALKGSTLLKKVNANPSDPSIRNEFRKWVNAGGKTLKGLVLRRTAEADLYFK